VSSHEADPVDRTTLESDQSVDDLDEYAKLEDVPRGSIWSMAHALSRRMRTAVEDGDWMTARQILAQRTVLIERFFSSEVGEVEARDVARAIREMLENDQSLQTISAEGRSDLKDKLGMLKLRRKARSTYSMP